MTLATLARPVSSAALQVSEILDDACDKLHNTIAEIYVASVDGFGTPRQLLERAMELDEFQLTEIICDSMPGDITLEDLAYASESEIYRMCHQELIAAI
jgi:hypothetical protein|tara:strand:- start:550 stop:846 length:297 start_codon:yes stop_codon:yes gene_type:complete